MPADESKVSKSRMEALVDGIFAFAMTLLVTGLVIPSISRTEAEAVLSERIAAMLPEFFSFLMAFFILASFWIGHHRQFHYIRTIDMWIVRLTLCILACVVLIPFTTSISGDFDNVRIAVDLFHGNLFILGSLFLLQWWYLVRTPEVTTDEMKKKDIDYGIRRSLLVPCISALGFLVAFISPRLSMMLYLLLIPGFFIVTYRSPEG